MALAGLVAACGGQTPDATVPTVAAPPDDGIAIAPMPSDQIVLSRAGKGPESTPIEGDYGPQYVLYARCRGDSPLLVTDADSEPWVVMCDGVPSRQQVLSKRTALTLRLTTGAQVEWSFAVAKQRAEG
ncbi:hypothetical protein AB0L70_16380 [Kribbella sp. NPDC051952]|uniref:hypothetical protein n=1 Tax=Kribbella sp. NPDC051952 TaxID=3154851 RepID=UPI00341F1A94